MKKFREYWFLLILICACLLLPKMTACATNDPAKGYALKYSLQGGVNHSSNPARYSPDDGTVVLENPSRVGYTFDGWYTSSSLENEYKITEITPDTKKIKRLYAKWTVNKYTVIFDGNGNDGTKKMADLVKAYHKKFTLTANKFKRNGYKFAGWNTERDGSGKTYKNKASVKKLTAEKDGSVTLYAQWKEVKYTISYKNAVVSLPKGILKSYTIASETIELPKLTRSGYTFDGWYTNKKYDPKSKIESIQTGTTGNKVLYARWEKGTSAGASGSRTLVAYFSATGNTKKLAKYAADLLNAELYEIVPKQKYTTADLNYNKDNCRANKEQNDSKARPKISSKKLNMGNYDTVVIAYPIWWGEEPRIIDTFMETYDFTGKTLVNFCTSGGSGIENSSENLKKMAPGATWKDGKRFSSSTTKDEMKKWLDGLDLTGNQEPPKEEVKEEAKEEVKEDIKGEEPPKEEVKEESKEEVKEDIKGEEPPKEEAKEEIKEEQKEESKEPSGGKKVLVAYFSATNNTKGIAEKIADAAGAVLYEIVPAEAYTSDDLNYNNSDSRANKEQNNAEARPEISSAKVNMEEYETVFIGYPIWWGEEPRIIDTFMETYDFTGKTLINFCTSGSSGISNSSDNLKKMAAGATWKEGKRFPSNATADEVRKWVEDLGIQKNKEIKDAKLKIQVGDTVMLADFEDNSSAKGFQEKLAEGAVTIEMSDYGNFEKVGALGFDLPRNDTQITTKPGDVILYQGNQITIYYDKNTWNFTRMAKIADKTQDELKKILGTGKVTVTFSLSE